MAIKDEGKGFLLARLQLAQQILEESDRLPRFKGFDLKSDKWWLHPRREREALVVYLLLTCFDYLGQEKPFISVKDWLNSKKNPYKSERNRVLDSLQKETPPIECARLLIEEYQTIYGNKNHFYQGITKLPEEARNALFSSIRLTDSPEYGKHGSNTSTPSFPLKDKELEKKYKLKYLYGKRNAFTHKLEQYFSLSAIIPFPSDPNNSSSWLVFIRDEKLSYGGSHQEHILKKEGGAYVYTLFDWPFVLFEVIYSALGIEFDRTTIDLKFQVMLTNSEIEKIFGRMDSIPHSKIKNYKRLAQQYWERQKNKESIGSDSIDR